MPDPLPIPEEAVTRAAEAVRATYGVLVPPGPAWPEMLARAALDAALPVLAEAWGVGADAPRTRTDWGHAWGDPDPAKASVDVYDDEEDAAEHLYFENSYVVQRRVDVWPWKRAQGDGGGKKDDGDA